MSENYCGQRTHHVRFSKSSANNPVSKHERKKTNQKRKIDIPYTDKEMERYDKKVKKERDALAKKTD